MPWRKVIKNIPSSCFYPQKKDLVIDAQAHFFFHKSFRRSRSLMFLNISQSSKENKSDRVSSLINLQC